MENDNTVIMEGVRIIFRNFAGKEGQFNQEGDRNFCVLLDPDVATKMAVDGWNVRSLNPRVDDDEEVVEAQPYLPVSLKYRGRKGPVRTPPQVFVITSRGRTRLGEDEVELLDWADIINVDLIVRPYEWSVNGKGGVKAYLASMYVTIQEDPLARKYAELEEAAMPRGGRVDE